MDKPIYPCQWCGSCPIWLGAYEEGQGLETEEKILEACEKYYHCKLPGTSVPEEVLNFGKV